MSAINDGGPVFGEFLQVDGNACRTGGMTLRDLFAAAALTGLISTEPNSPCDAKDPDGIEMERRNLAARVSTAAYRFADAMLAAREPKAVQP